MKNLLRKIREEYRTPVFGILFAGLSVLLFRLSGGSQLTWQASETAGGRVIADETSVQSGREAGGETETLTEAVTEETTEAQSERFTPAELAAPESETDAAGTVLWKVTEPGSGSEAEVSEAGLPLLLAKMRAAADFQIPMAAPETKIVEYREDAPERRWQIVSDRYRIGGTGSYDLVEVSPSQEESGGVRDGDRRIWRLPSVWPAEKDGGEPDRQV